MLRVAIIDDNPAIMFGVAAAIDRTEGVELVLSCSEVEDFIEKLVPEEVDVLVVDIVLDGVVGLNFFDVLRKKMPNKPIIAFSNAHGLAIEVSLERMGINKLVSKREPLSVLMEAILELENLELRNVTKKVKSEMPVLSDRECEIIQLLGKGFSSQDISENLNISHNTVNFHKKKLLKKFEVDSAAQLIRVAVELGIYRD